MIILLEWIKYAKFVFFENRNKLITCEALGYIKVMKVVCS